MDTLADAFELTRALVALETPTGSEGPATDLLDGALRRAGYRTVRQPVTPGRDNLLAFREPPALVFSTHVDCVPPYLPLTEDADDDPRAGEAATPRASPRPWWRRRSGWPPAVSAGSACCSWSARRTAPTAPRAADLEPRGRFLVNGEPTENRLSIGQKGSLRIDLQATGRAAHSAYPEEGESAVAALLDTIERIRRMPLPHDPLLGTLDAQRRAHPRRRRPERPGPGGERADPDPHRGAHRTAQDRDRGARGTRRRRVTFPVELPWHKAGAVPAGWDTTVVSYASDLPFLASWGEGYQLGPGTIKVAHSPHEHIRKADLLRGVDLYVRLATDLLASEAP